MIRNGGSTYLKCTGHMPLLVYPLEATVVCLIDYEKTVQWTKLKCLRNQAPFWDPTFSLHFQPGLLSGMDNSGQPTIHTTSYSSDVDRAHVHLQGRGSWFCNLFDHKLAAFAKRKLKEKVRSNMLQIRVLYMYVRRQQDKVFSYSAMSNQRNVLLL